MKDSTRRALRTGYQAIVAAIVVVPVVVWLLQSLFPEGSKAFAVASAVAGAMVTVTAAASKAINALEAAGKIPAWLKQPAATGANPDPESAPIDDEPGRHAAD